MKKYIWAKDTPFNKKGSEIEIGSSKDEAYVFGSASMGHSVPIQVLRTQRKSINDLISEGWVEEVNTRWKPDNGYMYWYITMLGEVRCHRWGNDTYDNSFYPYGNVFKTKEEAEAAAEKVKALLLSLHE